MEWIKEHWPLLSSVSLTGLGVWWLMPSTWPRARAVGVFLVLVGCGLLASQWQVASGEVSESVQFWIYAVGALASAVLMITSRNPVYAALWFALVTLSTCGLFLLQY